MGSISAPTRFCTISAGCELQPGSLMTPSMPICGKIFATLYSARYCSMGSRWSPAYFRMMFAWWLAISSLRSIRQCEPKIQRSWGAGGTGAPMPAICTTWWPSNRTSASSECVLSHICSTLSSGASFISSNCSMIPTLARKSVSIGRRSYSSVMTGTSLSAKSVWLRKKVSKRDIF